MILEGLLEIDHATREALARSGVIVTVILASICFEAAIIGAIKLLRNRNVPAGASLVNAVCKELSILGVISILLMACIRTGLVQVLNDRFMGVSETESAALKEAAEEGVKIAPPTLLKEVFEFVHVFVFIVMATFICEGALLVVLMLNFIKRYRKYDSETATSVPIVAMTSSDTGLISEKDESNEQVDALLGQGQELIPTMTKKRLLRFFGLKQRFQGNGISLSCLLNRCDSTVRNVSFSFYLIEAITELMVENIEIPVSSLLALLAVVPLLRPLFTMFGMNFIIAISLVTSYLSMGILVLFILTDRIYKKVCPAASTIKLLTANPIEMKQLETRHNIKSLQDVQKQLDVLKLMDAPIDKNVPLSKDFLGRLRNATDGLFPTKRPQFIRRIMQFWLVLTAALISAIFVSATAGTKGATDSWGMYGKYVIGPLIVLILINFYLWSLTLERFAIATVVDYGTDRHLLHTIHSEAEMRQINREASIWRLILNRSRLVDTNQTSVNVRQARVMEEYVKLPANVRHPIELVFSMLGKHADTLGRDEKVPGVILREDVNMALELLGISAVAGQPSGAQHGGGHNEHDLYTAGSDSSDEFLDLFDSLAKKAELNLQRFLSFGDFVLIVLSSTEVGEVLQDKSEDKRRVQFERGSFFNSMDTDQDGRVSLDSLVIKAISLVPSLNEAQAMSLMQRMTKSERSEVTKVEFMRRLKFLLHDSSC